MVNIYNFQHEISLSPLGFEPRSSRFNSRDSNPAPKSHKLCIKKANVKMNLNDADKARDCGKAVVSND